MRSTLPRRNPGRRNLPLPTYHLFTASAVPDIVSKIATGVKKFCMIPLHTKDGFLDGFSLRERCMGISEKE
jgi:hypothetical protein